jgi:hypothetical protein
MANVAAIRFVAFFCGLLGVIFLITAIPTHHWYHAKPYNATNTPHGFHTEEIYGGIFENCHTSSDGSYSCKSNESDGYLKSTKAFLILGIVGYAAIIVYTLVTAFTRGICFKALGFGTLLTAFFIMIAMSIYTDQHPDLGENMEYGWSFSLGWASFVFTLLAGIMAFFGSADYDKL